MTTSQEMDQQFGEGEIERRLKDLERKIEAYEQGGFDIFRQFGYLQLGLDLPRLDNTGVQFQTPTPASADVPTIYWLNEYSLTPDDDVPRTYLAGRADPSTATFPNGIFSYRLEAINGERYGRIRHSVVADGSAANLMEFWHGSAAPSQDLEYGQFYLPGGGGSHFHRFIGGDYVLLSGLPLQLSMSAAPATLLNGMIWYNTTTTTLNGYINGGTVALSGNGTELTIATGVIAITSAYHRVDTEADAATDDLATINGGVMGQMLTLRAENGARDVVVKDGTGNLQLEGDCTLNNVQDTITLIYDSNLTAWLEVARSNNGA